MSRKFGWSLPPGVTNRMIDEQSWSGFCEICGQNVDADECICPECPECFTVGDPKCYLEHGLHRSEDQKFLKEIAKREWAEEAEALNQLYFD